MDSVKKGYILSNYKILFFRSPVPLLRIEKSHQDQDEYKQGPQCLWSLLVLIHRDITWTCVQIT
jgi:hypothetical protein